MDIIEKVIVCAYQQLGELEKDNLQEWTKQLLLVNHQQTDKELPTSLDGQSCVDNMLLTLFPNEEEKTFEKSQEQDESSPNKQEHKQEEIEKREDVKSRQKLYQKILLDLDPRTKLFCCALNQQLVSERVQIQNQLQRLVTLQEEVASSLQQCQKEKEGLESQLQASHEQQAMFDECKKIYVDKQKELIQQLVASKAEKERSSQSYSTEFEEIKKNHQETIQRLTSVVELSQNTHRQKLSEQQAKYVSLLQKFDSLNEENTSCKTLIQDLNKKIMVLTEQINRQTIEYDAEKKRLHTRMLEEASQKNEAVKRQKLSDYKGEMLQQELSFFKEYCPGTPTS